MDKARWVIICKGERQSPVLDCLNRDEEERNVPESGVQQLFVQYGTISLNDILPTSY